MTGELVIWRCLLALSATDPFARSGCTAFATPPPGHRYHGFCTFKSVLHELDGTNIGRCRMRTQVDWGEPP